MQVQFAQQHHACFFEPLHNRSIGSRDIVFEDRAVSGGAHSGGLNQVEGIGPKTAEKIKEADGVLIVVDADRKLRYDRIFARKTGKDLVDFDTFVEQEEREWFGAEGEHDMNIKKVMDMADHTIFNNGTLPELHTQIDELLANLFK